MDIDLRFDSTSELPEQIRKKMFLPKKMRELTLN